MTTETVSDFWIAHDEPERPLNQYAFLCDCDRCALAVAASGLRDSTLRLIVRFGCTRVLLDPTEYLEHRADLPGGFAPGDYVRDVSVAPVTNVTH